MIIHEYCDKRALKKESLRFELVVIGGGISGVCCAITAARQGIKVGLFQDRPVLGGNASSEVRIWVLGATSHMGNNNRWSREGGVIDEILVENLHRNREGNPHLFDMVLIDKVLAEKNISLFLNTIVSDVVKKSDRMISGIKAFNPQNGTLYEIEGTVFADCSGDGIVAFLSGASFRIGAEDKEDYNEGFAPDKETYGELLGDSIVFYTKETENPVRYIAPAFAHPWHTIESVIPKVNNPNYFKVDQHGCKFWWLEYGGRLDTVHDTERIKYELWSVVYGVWDYIKNSGKYPETANQTLEWVGLIPGKRESRRFIGYYTLTQSDVIDQPLHYDAVAYGGWSIDMHPADAVYSPLNGCNQWHSKGVYQIPYRTLVSRDIDNLFIGGRIMSASHVAYGSSRVMCTSAHGAQAIGMASAIVCRTGCSPADLIEPNAVGELQQKLINTGHFIPSLDVRDEHNLLHMARLNVSSYFDMNSLPFDGNWFSIDYPAAQLLPLPAKIPKITFEMDAQTDTQLTIQLRRSSKPINFTPDVILEEQTIDLKKGVSRPKIKFEVTHSHGEYLFVCLMTNPLVRVRMSTMLVSSITSVFNYINPAVSNYGKQEAPEDIGIESFEFWCPKRRPQGVNFAFELDENVSIFGVENLQNAYYRPTINANCWIASPKDEYPVLSIDFDELKTISHVRLFFDTDFDHAMENVQMGHHDSDIPLCVRDYELCDDEDNLLFRCTENYTTCNDIILDNSLDVKGLRLKLHHPSPSVPASLFGIIIK